MSVVISLSPIISNFDCCEKGYGILHLEGVDQVQRAESWHYQDNGEVVMQVSAQPAGWTYSLIAYNTDRGLAGSITQAEYEAILNIKDLSPPQVLTLSHPKETFRCVLHQINLQEFDNVANPGEKSLYTGTIQVRKI
jgi:hypothetical protein